MDNYSIANRRINQLMNVKPTKTRNTMKTTTIEQIIENYQNLLFKTNLELLPNAENRYIVLNYTFDNWTKIKTEAEHKDFLTFVNKPFWDSVSIKTIKDLFNKAKEDGLLKDTKVSSVLFNDFDREINTIIN